MFGFDYQDILRAALVFLRVGGIFVVVPIFGDSPTPLKVRILLSGAVSLALYSLVPPGWTANFNVDVLGLTLLLGRELLIGLVIGFVAKLTFEGLITTAAIVGYQMGFGTASLFMVSAEERLTSFEALHRTLIFLIFLSLRLHHIFIKAIFDTFMIIAPGGSLPKIALGKLMISLSADIFTVALQLAAPIFVALLFTMAVLGLIARTVPQMQVFTMSFPISFFLGLFVYLATFAFYPDMLVHHFENTKESIYLALRSFTP